MTPAAATAEQPTVEFIDGNGDEWKQSVREALDELGLTYEQLACQAETGDFDSYSARRLWVFVGGTRL